MYPPGPAGQNGSGHPPATSSGELRTVFITGFPADTKERELLNLLRFLPGYEACQLHTRTATPLGFGLFVSTMAAQAAVRTLTGLSFDPDHNLRAQIARNNMSLDAGQWRWQGVGSATSSAGGAASAASTRDHPPCNTLYIGNLGDGVEEAELNNLFTPLQGFQRLRVLRGARTVSAFVVFDDTPSATAAREAVQGSALPSSDRGPIRIQFSRNPSSTKRDATAAQLPPDGGWTPMAPPQRPRYSDES